MRSIAPVKSASVTASAPRRVASNAASLTRLARSAPVKPGVSAATVSRSTSGLIVILRHAPSGSAPGPACRAGRPAPGGRTGRRAAAPDRGSRGGWWRPSRIMPARGSKPSSSDEQLVQRLLLLVVAAAAGIGAAGAAERVELVDEDDAGRLLARLLEQVAHPRGADADEHLDEFRAVDREERHAGLARDGARQQRLAGAGRARPAARPSASARRAGHSAPGPSGRRRSPAVRPWPRRPRRRRRRSPWCRSRHRPWPCCGRPTSARRTPAARRSGGT